MNDSLNSMRGKKVLVVGMGRSGIAATQALVKLGAKVSVQDSKKSEEFDSQLVTYLTDKDVKCFFHKVPDNVTSFDMIVLSPGVLPTLGFIQEAQKAGVEIIGELEIAYRVGSGKYVAITGTNGKTTTTTLVGEIFRNAKKKTYVVGNIGVAVISMAMEANENSWLITETSSFQLETIKYFKPEVSAILNLSPDHMDRHKTMKNYGKAKARIFENQDEKGFAIVNYDDKECWDLAKDCKANVIPFSSKEELKTGAFVKSGKIVIADADGSISEICGKDELKIPGEHNLENALAAVAISYFAGIDKETIAATLREFQGVEHRLEFCGEIDGVRFVNDSKGTNPDASIKAIESMPSDTILIAGGYDKGSSFDELIKAFDGKVKHMVLLGKTASKIKESAERLGFKNTLMVKDMDACVKESFRLAKPGDTVLLSPACASWDMYSDFEQRGKHFKNCVDRLEK